jgi:hypothetical protein
LLSCKVDVLPADQVSAGHTHRNRQKTTAAHCGQQHSSYRKTGETPTSLGKPVETGGLCPIQMLRSTRAAVNITP